MKRRTIGEDPLDAVVPMAAPPPPKVEKPKAAETPKPPKVRAAVPEVTATREKGKERLTVHLPLSVIDRAKNAVYYTPGLTLAGLAESAFLKALEKIEKDNGGPFPARAHELKGGRPMK